MMPCQTDRNRTHDIATHLRDLFGFTSFRPHQEDIVRAILEKRDVFAVLPTGGGKSLCFQLPAHLLPGTCLVISPLISLMKDQVDAAKANGLRADFLNSSQTAKERAAVTERLKAGHLGLLYASPERFAMPDFMALLKTIRLSFVAIDEAHCISDWGHDFRPDYMRLADITREFPGTPIAAFTATATMQVQQDIIRKLGLRKPHIVRASFNRPNLYYQVTQKYNAEEQILRFAQARPRQRGIIYRTTRADVESTADHLRRHGLRALPYHAGLDDDVRTRHQDAFDRNEADVIVATIAFGMGIDKPDIRYVVHGDLPKNIEGYYQETGRAGRDGKRAHCLLMFSPADIPRVRWFLDKISEDAVREHAHRCLEDMISYALHRRCRRRELLRYFSETYPERICGMCDGCGRP